jgi:hypothetical protein
VTLVNNLGVVAAEIETKIDNRFCLHAIWNNTRESRELGVDLVRGIYHFDIDKKAERNWISIYQSAGLNIALTITPTAKAWANAVISNIDLSRISGKEDICGFPGNVEAYKKDLSRLIENIDGDGIDDYPELRRPIKYIQVGNEIWWQWYGDPPSFIRNKRQLQIWKTAHQNEAWRSYGEFLKITYETIKAKNPDIQVILGAPIWDVDIQDKAENRGISDNVKMILNNYSRYFDIIDIHFYGDSLKLERDLEKIGQLFTMGKPVWFLELGGPMKDYNFKRHAEEVVKLQMVLFEKGIDKLFWSSLVPTIGWHQCFLNTALLDEKFNKKPAYYTYKILNEKINYFTSLRKIDPQEHIYKVEFKDKNTVFVLWSESGEKITDLSGYITGSKVKVTRIITEQGKTDKDAQAEIAAVNAIKISETPIFVEEAEK